MRTLLLSAGLGTRLRPITDSLPKCLVPIAGKPLLQIWLERLAKAGVGPFLINTHYLADQVVQFVEKSDFRDVIELTHEAELLGTAGTLIRNLDFFQNEDGMVIHADNYCQANFRSFLNAHYNRPSGCVMTMMTFRTDDPSSCGIVEVDDLGVVTEFHEKVDSPPGNLANGAVYILSAELLKEMEEVYSHVNDLSTEVLHKLRGRIFTYETSDIFIDVGTQERYREAVALAVES